MSTHRFDAEATRIRTLFSVGPRLVVVGSTSFYGKDSRLLCEVIAKTFASLPSLVCVTGGMDGVGKTFAESFFNARRSIRSTSETLYHLLPQGMSTIDCGTTLGAGFDLDDRREILGRIGQVYLVIEGGPGTEHEVSIATTHGHPRIPLAMTGGEAASEYDRLPCPAWATIDDWKLLANIQVSPVEIAPVILKLFLAAIDARVQE